MQTDSCAVENTDFFESQRRVPQVLFEEFEIFVGQIPYFRRQLPVVKPEIRRSKMIHNGEQRPASKSASALAAR